MNQGYQSSLTLDDCGINAICKAANKGDALACEVIEHVGRHLGKAIAIAINLFNPQKVVIAGEIAEADKVLLPAIESCINTQALKAFRKNLPVVPSEARSSLGDRRFRAGQTRHAQRSALAAIAGKLIRRFWQVCYRHPLPAVIMRNSDK